MTDEVYNRFSAHIKNKLSLISCHAVVFKMHYQEIMTRNEEVSGVLAWSVAVLPWTCALTVVQSLTRCVQITRLNSIIAGLPGPAG